MADENESERDDEETRDEDGADGDEAEAPSRQPASDGGGDDGDDEESPDETAKEPEKAASASASEETADASEDDLSRREKAEAEAAAREAAEEADHPAAASITALLGVERWVQFAFIAAGVALFFLADNLTRFVWAQFGEPDGAIVSAVAGATAVLGAFALYRHPQVNQLATEVITELRDVTWPSRDEVYYSTIVVIVTSVVAAVYTGVFDAFWSFVTNTVYGG
jgi:preprotein translocase subunit SecE